MLSEGDRIHLHVYGIASCDTCRSTLKWLQTRKVPHTFHDFRKEGLSADRLRAWLASDHAQLLVNRRSTTWRQLSDEEKAQAESRPMELLLEHPMLIKRPVITQGDAILDVGFAPRNLEDYV